MAKTSGTESGAATSARRRELLDFLDKNEGLVTALQDAAKERLTAGTQAGEAAPRSVRFEIKVGTRGEPEEGHLEADQGPGSYCWDAEYICGKGPNGYIYCHVTVCDEVGPVFLSR